MRACVSACARRISTPRCTSAVHMCMAVKEPVWRRGRMEAEESCRGTHGREWVVEG